MTVVILFMSLLFYCTAGLLCCTALRVGLHAGGGHVGILTIHNDSEARLDFIQNMQYKFVVRVILTSANTLTLKIMFILLCGLIIFS